MRMELQICKGFFTKESMLQLYAMELGDIASWKECGLLRVPGGWLYTNSDGCCLLIPFTLEGKVNNEPKKENEDG